MNKELIMALDALEKENEIDERDYVCSYREISYG